MEGKRHSIIRGDHMRNERYPTVPIERDEKRSVLNGICQRPETPLKLSLHYMNVPV